MHENHDFVAPVNILCVRPWLHDTLPCVLIYLRTKQHRIVKKLSLLLYPLLSYVRMKESVSQSVDNSVMIFWCLNRYFVRQLNCMIKDASHREQMIPTIQATGKLSYACTLSHGSSFVCLSTLNNTVRPQAIRLTALQIILIVSKCSIRVTILWTN